MVSRARITPPAPSVPSPLPGWARLPIAGQPLDGAAVFAGAALACLHPVARDDHPLGRLWRQRLALRSTAALAGQGGRTEDEVALRDHWYLRRADDDPGPAGRLLKAWRVLGTGAAMHTGSWRETLAANLDLRRDEVLDDLLAFAVSHTKGKGSPVAAAAEVAAMALRRLPFCPPLALWLADAVLAHRLQWPSPVPLLAGQLRPADLRLGAAHAAGEGAWLEALNVAYARGGAMAVDLYADLARRAQRLLAVVPKLRGKDADWIVAALIAEDAQAARAAKAASDRSSRRLFERLVALGAVRELTGRPTFRLYGL
jgi:hypothetical protein